MGREGPPDPEADPHHDLIVNNFTELTESLEC